MWLEVVASFLLCVDRFGRSQVRMTVGTDQCTVVPHTLMHLRRNVTIRNESETVRNKWRGRRFCVRELTFHLCHLCRVEDSSRASGE